MHVLITLARFTVGGTETYTLTVAEKLESLGHRVTVHVREASDLGLRLAADRELSLKIGPSPPLEGIDAALCQDGSSACLVAAERPDLRMVFVTHGMTDYERLPDALRLAPPVIAMSDRIADYVGAAASTPPVVRLRQPIDLMRYKPRDPTGPRARRILALGNYLEGPRLEMLQGVCDGLGLELIRSGAQSTPTLNPEVAIAEADIVVGYGRAVLEAMAMGRAAYVWDYMGGDGWVTPESYPAMEADGFNGAATDAVIDAGTLRSDLGNYRPELGQLGSDLIFANHSVAVHVEALVDLLGSSGSPETTAGLEEMATLIRGEARATQRAAGLDLELRRVVVEREELRRQAIETEQRVTQERATQERERLARIEEEHLEQLAAADDEIERQRLRAETAESTLAEMFSSSSWRLTAPLRGIRRPRS